MARFLAVARALRCVRPLWITPSVRTCTTAAAANLPKQLTLDGTNEPAGLLIGNYFAPILADGLSVYKTWDELLFNILRSYKIQKKSPIRLFLQLEKRGLLGNVGRNEALLYFLEENDTAMIEYCLKIFSVDCYQWTVFPKVVYYLEMLGRHEEVDKIIQGSLVIFNKRAMCHERPDVCEIVTRAIGRSFPHHHLMSHVSNTTESSNLCSEFHDPSLVPIDRPVQYRAKYIMTRREFREAFEREMYSELQPVTSCNLLKVDALNIVTHTANAGYTAKVVRFTEQLIKQWKVGVHDYIVKRQMVLREILFHPEVLESSDYTASSYYADLLMLQMDPVKAAEIMSGYFYTPIVTHSQQVTTETTERLCIEISKLSVCFMGNLDDHQVERLYKLYEQIHFDLSEDMARLPVRLYMDYLKAQGEKHFSARTSIHPQYLMRVLSQIILNTLHIGRFKRLNGEWSPVLTYDADMAILRLDPALDEARLLYKDTRRWKHILVAKFPMECPPMFNSCLTDGGGKLFLYLANVMTCLTPLKISTVVGDALDAVGQTPFRLEPRVVDAITARLNELALDRSDYILCVPPAKKTLKLVQSLSTDVSGLSASLLAKQASEEFRGMREDICNRLTVANHFRDERPFWGIPVLDFRGRMYNRSSFLAATSPDVVRGMLRFGPTVPLGTRGWEWLRVHMANLHGGFKKKSRAEKVEFVNNRMDDIMRSVDRPNDGFQWWKECDSPVQALLCCHELVDAVRSGCPETFASNLPVHQDGSCNGMQHYSALGRDLEGAKLVSLSAEPSSLDLYTSVAKKVEEKLLSHMANPLLPELFKELSKKCLPYAQRKIVKQTVMTTVYGVTRAGAQIQIERCIKRQYGQHVADLSRISPHMVKTIFEVLDDVFAVARKIQRWLMSCVLHVSKKGYFMTWTSPLGLVVEQPYASLPLGNLVKTRLFQPSFVTDLGGEFDPRLVDVSMSKHSIAFAPNLIHSLDATHLMMTSVAMRKEGILFGAVHDSYWTHAAHVDDMNRIIREQFVSLYSQPIIENLAAQLQMHFGDPEVDWKEDVFMNFPKPGTFDLKEVLRSERFFS